jgi:drug/metabolite transporter (DMT)-like permease
LSTEKTSYSSPTFPPVLVLAIGVLAVSTSAILIRYAQGEAPSLVIAAGRLTIAALILVPWALATRRDEFVGLSRREWFLALLSGTFLGIHFASWISSLDYTGIASSTVLVSTSPLWVGLASPFVLKERLSKPVKVGIVLATIGSILIALTDQGGATGGSNPLLGNGLALLGAFGGATYLLIGRKLRSRLSLLTYTAIVYGGAALFLLLLLPISGLSLFGYSWQIYGLLLLMALGPQLLGHQSFNWALGHLPASYVSITVISEPIGAAVLAWLVLGESPTGWVVAGGVLIIAGIFISAQNK